MFFFDVNFKKCNSCNICNRLCSIGAIKKNNKNKYDISYNKCFSCSMCFFVCPVISIEFKSIKLSFTLNDSLINKIIILKKTQKKKNYIFLENYYDSII